MSTSNSNPEPGWYHAQGDEPGTVRLWNGHQWVGFAQRDPNGPRDEIAATKPWEPVLGQVRLKWFAIPAQISLSCMALLYAAGGILFLIFAATADSDTFNTSELSEPTLTTTTDTDPGGIELLFGLGIIAFIVVAVLGPILFLIWFWRAYANMALWRENQFDTFWAFLGWIVPFINLRRPWKMVMELVENSSDDDHAGDLNPVWGLVWWVFFWAPQALTNLLFVGALNDPAAVAEDPSSVATGLVFGLGVSFTLSAVSLVCMVVIMSKVTAQQDQRMEPSALQIARYERDEAERATFATNAHAATPEFSTF